MTDFAKVPEAENCVLRPLLERQAAAQPDRVFARFEDDSEWTYAQTLARTRARAAGLAQLGVGQGDRVMVWMPNSAAMMETWFAINYLGAVFVPVNLAYKGLLLERVIHNSQARLAVVHPDLVARLADVDTGALATVVVTGAPGPAVPGLRLLSYDQVTGDPATLTGLAPVQPWDIQMIIFTSGTTGPSKGVLCPYAHTYATGMALTYITARDRELVILPLFHVGGASLLYQQLVKGGSVAVVDSFDTRSFWDVVRRTQATSMTLIGVMAPFLLKAPPTARDRDHTLRVALMIPHTEHAPEFRRRFGVEIFTAFNMTEISTPLVAELNTTVYGTAGRPRAGVEVRIVDENDCEVPVGTAGELIIRTATPWAMNAGYNADPAATAQAWRNGWFHTGDGFRRDADGYYFFVDRMKDAIRRRGENISSFEVELYLTAQPQIRECAAVAVASADAEDEVMVVVSLVEGATLDLPALVGDLAARMPHFMVPRYFRVVPELPRTPTQKVQKYQLRQQGITDDTWDREAAGIIIKRHRFTS